MNAIRLERRGMALFGMVSLGIFISLMLVGAESDVGIQGYYRFPAIHANTIVFTAEGDLWKIGVEGGVARRLTSHQGDETHASISPDGKTLAFIAEYEGPNEVYTMPITGGLPVRRTYEGGVSATGWTPDGKLLFATDRHSTLPDTKLATIDITSGDFQLIPLSQASEGAYESTGKTIFFTRYPYRYGANTKRYRGGTAQNLWKFTTGTPEAVQMQPDYSGVSRHPMTWQGRVYFVTDRDGTLNLWSMNPDGEDLRQHTKHKGREVRWPSLSEGRIVYQLGPDLRLYDIAADRDAVISVTLASDFDQQREKWVKRPMEYVTSAHISPDGDRVVITARGQVFVAPVGPGRLVDATRDQTVRHRDAKFLPNGESILALSDRSGELEFEKLPANGIGSPEQLTSDGKVLRYSGEPSPDGKYIAYNDKNDELWLFNVEQKKSERIAVSRMGPIGDLAWSPDSKWLAYAHSADNTYAQIWLYRLSDGSKTALTDDRLNSYSPAWSPDGKWIYFLSDRSLRSVVPSPWGIRQPEPYFDKPIKIMLVSLTKDQRSPFEPADELHPDDKSKKKEREKERKDDKEKKKMESRDKIRASKHKKKPLPPEGIAVDLDGIQERLTFAPVSAGNYESLSVNDKRVFWISKESEYGGRQTVMELDIDNDDPKAKAFAEDVRSYELSLDGKKMLVWKGDTFFVTTAGSGPPAKLEEKAELGNWSFSFNPRDEWRQMFTEAWRLERDYFYDTNMHAVDWPAMLKKYLPDVSRVSDRAELSDLIAEMVSELSALHIFVFGGDQREGPDQISHSGLGATLVRDAARKGWRIEHIYRADPDYPDQLSPLVKQGVNLKEGDVIEMVNGVPSLSAPHIGALLRNQAGRQVLLRINRAGETKPREVVVTPVSLGREADLRYDEWEYTRRKEVEKQGKGDIGYVHLRAMGQSDIADWARDFYPVYNRKGLIVDVRHNGGGNIDSWILEKLIRKAWFYWQPRVGMPTWNMQYAFRGHVVVLCDAHTGSDGEAFSEGFKRLQLGKVIGTRTWGGEIWLSMSNWLVDKGIATAAEIGVYGPEGKWLVENHGVDPDIVVDNAPHATFNGEDAQLKRAIEYLQEEIKNKPVDVPPAPPHPDKSFK